MKIKLGTLIRTLCLFLALINQILSYSGYSILPITNDQLSQFITLLFTISSAIISWWKNNSFSQSALKGDQYIQRQKKERR